MDSLTVKTIAVFAIIFGCFAVLYPKIFHPMFANMFGAAPAQQADNDMFKASRPGQLHKTGKGGKHKNRPGDDFPHHLRGGPHPGMRAAAEMKKQMAPQGGNSGRGMMGIVLPMYAVGIVVYLIYTLSKVFGNKKKDGDDYLTGHFKKDEQKKKKKSRRSNEEADNDDQARHYRQVKRSQKDLEKLLLKADKDDLTECDMRDLRHRLLDTEKQMTRILQAMQDVEEKVTDMSTELSDSGEESDESIGEQMAKLEELVQKRQQTFNARKVAGEQEKKSATGEEVADTGSESHDNGSGKTDKFSVPESSAVAETIGPMEYTDFPEDDSDSSDADGSASNTEDIDAGECVASRDLDSKGQFSEVGESGLDSDGQFIPCRDVGESGLDSDGQFGPCSEVGESGDHSELRKRTPAAIGEENK